MAWTNNVVSGGLSAVPANGGIGFQPWTSFEQGDINVGQYFLASSVANNFGNVDSSNGLAFGMYAEGPGNTVNVYRKMILGLMVGGYFTAKFATQFRNGSKGVVVLTNGTPRFNFDIGSDQYRYSNTWTGTSFINFTNTGWPYSSTSVFTLSVQRPSENLCLFTVTRDADAFDPIPRNTGPIIETSSTNVNEIQFYTSQTDVGGGTPNNLFFNFLSAYNAYPI